MTYAIKEIDKIQCADHQLQVMALDFTVRHHTSGVNALTLSPDGDRLLSGGEKQNLTLRKFLTELSR